jgi:hypothetical protein
MAIFPFSIYFRGFIMPYRVQLGGVRKAGILHRAAVTAADTLVKPTLVTIATAATGGSLLDITTYKVSAAPGNEWGSAGSLNILSQATAADAPHTHSLTLTLPACAGATYWDIFCSVDAAPLWVGRITEAQVAAGDYRIATYGATPTTGGGNAARTVLLMCAGTGLAMNVSPFIANNAWKPTTPTSISCPGWGNAILHFEVTVTDLRSLPAFSWCPFYKSQSTDSTWYAGSAIAMTIGGSNQPLKQVVDLDLDGALEFVILLSDFSGQGTSVDVWVEDY